MSKLKRGCSGCFALLLVLCAMQAVVAETGAADSGAQMPAILVTFSGDGAPEPIVFALSPELNESWLWIQVSQGTPLDAVDVRYTPESEGVLHWTNTAHEYEADFTRSETEPPAFIVESLIDGAVLWTGWLTVSHSARPDGLADVSPPYEWPGTETEPHVTQEPSEIPMPDPTQPPVAETDPPPLPQMTVWPTERPPQPPPQNPTDTPFPQMTVWPTERPPQNPTGTPLPQMTVWPTERPHQRPSRNPTGTPLPQMTVWPTERPQQRPSRNPTGTPLPQATWPPPQPTPGLKWTSSPSPAPTPLQQAGYGLITANNVNLRNQPGGSIIGKLQRGSVLYISGQAYIGENETWNIVTVMDTLENGYVRADLTRFMTPQEISEYMSRPTPRPTARPTRTPAAATGYARIIWQNVPLRSSPSSGATSLKTLTAGNAVYVSGQAVDGYKTLWLLVRAEDGQHGYVVASALTMMTPAEIAEYLAASAATPVPSASPTVSPTLNPSYSYAVVRMNNVNFRISPEGQTIYRVHTGTLATLLSDIPVGSGDIGWYRVLIGEEVGYLREDMVDVIQIRPTPTPRPTLAPTPSLTPAPTPAPTPTPTPMLLPTAGPTGVLDKIRAAVDSTRYLSFAREQTVPTSYAVRDFDSDKLMELLLVTLGTEQDGRIKLELAAWKLNGGEVKLRANKVRTPVLTPGTELQVVLLEQAGREMVYIAQRNTSTNAAFGGMGLTLTESGWVEISLTNAAKNPVPLLLAFASADGTITVEDCSDLRAPYLSQEEVEQEHSALAAIFRVLLVLFQNIANGNG